MADVVVSPKIESAEALQQYVPRIQQILESADLDKTTARGVRKQLEKEFNVDLSQWRVEMDTLIVELLNGLPSEDDEDNHKHDDTAVAQQPTTAATSSHTGTETPKQVTSSKKRKSTATNRGTRSKKVKSSEFIYSSDEEVGATDPSTEGDAELARRLQEEENGVRRTRNARSTAASKPKKRATRSSSTSSGRASGFTQPLVLSAALAELMGASEMSRPEVVKRIWEYVKSKGLQDPSDRRYIVLDEGLQPVLGPGARVHMFTMNKILSKHLISKDDIVGGNSSCADHSEPPDDQIQVRPPKTQKVKEKRETKERKNNPFMRPLFLSPALADVLGATEMSRPQVVRQLWIYIKANNLQDPKDRRYFFCDDKLKRVFKTQRVHAWHMNSALSAFLTKKDDNDDDIIDSEPEEPDDLSASENEVLDNAV
ncbi:hypothetical protein HDU85_004161 [Gaertneriomyces sp. JEL0708]|nr:hypothetical protein HDU85_004161 [Gaertneriomyces sp. JEL0708]